MPPGLERAHHGRVRPSRPSLAGILLALGMFAGCLDITEVQFGRLDVLVIDDHGDPVSGAQVEPHGGWHWWHRRAVGVTDREGRAQFRLPPTTYRVFAHPPLGYAHRDPPFWATMQEVSVSEEAVSVTLVFLRADEPPESVLAN